MDSQTVSAVLENQRAFFASNITKDIVFRRKQLLALKNGITEREQDILDALRRDLGKSSFEAYSTEIAMVQEELSFMLKHLRSWAKPRKVKTPLINFPSESVVYPEPFGCVLVMAPWNYPFQLALAPLAAALCAGNCAIVKPSNYSPSVSAVVESLLNDVFPPEYVAVVTGGREANASLLELKFDYIFFTGSPSVGKIVMQAAAAHLTPVSLELGGKSPCIVDASASVELAAKRIVWGKLLNAGQTCVAPDYVLAHESVKDALIAALRRQITAFYGSDPAHCDYYPNIINEKHYRRLAAFCDGSDPANGTVLCADGADDSAETAFNDAERKIAPVVLDGPAPDSPVMSEEIFGPVLPVLSVASIEEAVSFIRERPEPLALYLFTGDVKAEKYVLRSVRFGGGCVNDTIMHLTSSYLPFGGTGNSGIGSYHGKAGFDTFTHYKSVLSKSVRIDVPFRYPPYTGNLNLIKRFMK